MILKGLIRKLYDCNGKSTKKLIFSNGFIAFATHTSFIKHKNKNYQPSKKDFKVDIYSFFEKRVSQVFLGGALIFTLLVPQTASASIFDIFTRTVNAETSTDTVIPSQSNSQKMALAEPNVGPDTSDNSSSNSDTLINNSTLTPKVGPLGSNLDIADIPEGGGQISIYTVHDGDTIGSVAAMFDVSKATVISANDLTPNQSLKKGMVLAIPPVSGHLYTVKKGDTITSISKKFNTDAVDIAIYNDLEINSDLVVGDNLIIPDINFTEISSPAKTTTKKPAKNTEVIKSPAKNNSTKISGPLTAHPMRVNIKVDLGNALLRPVSINSSRRSQGAHDLYGSAVDLAAPIGTPIMAAADGTVVLARDFGYNGGYGEYVIIMSNIDGNIVQTIYAHMSKVGTTIGAQVRRGEIIGYVGSTGRSTGPHCHFEVHGALNPLTLNPNYTGL